MRSHSHFSPFDPPSHMVAYLSKCVFCITLVAYLSKCVFCITFLGALHLYSPSDGSAHRHIDSVHAEEGGKKKAFLFLVVLIDVMSMSIVLV